jgi:hypothetical protein
MLNQLPPNIFEFIRGGQRLRTGRIMATFADDAMVSDNVQDGGCRTAAQPSATSMTSR